MMEIIRTYPLIFIFTVILPLAGGFVGAYLGWDSLKSRVEKFQQEHSLRADGVAGHHTLITLNSLTKNDYPTLSFSGVAN